MDPYPLIMVIFYSLPIEIVSFPIQNGDFLYLFGMFTMFTKRICWHRLRHVHGPALAAPQLRRHFDGAGLSIGGRGRKVSGPEKKPLEGSIDVPNSHWLVDENRVV